MIKLYCNHCGKELGSREICTLDSSDVFFDKLKNKSIWYNVHLCPECAELRIRAHCDLDNEFLGRSK